MKKKLNNLFCNILFAATLVFILCNCGKKEEAPPSPTPQVPSVSKPQENVQKQASSAHSLVQKQVSSANLPHAVGSGIDFNTQKDPFKPFLAATKAAPVVKRNRLGQILPILNYDVSQFKITGIIVGLNQNSAMVVDPAGKPYVVKAGMDIGRNNGIITKITPNFIEVYEQYRDESGKLIKKTVRLTLPKKE
jgi:type IV pilus assembly protein PilP